MLGQLDFQLSDWHMVFFTTPELLEIGGAALDHAVRQAHWLEALRYYRRVVDTFDLQISLQRGRHGDRARRRRRVRGRRRPRRAAPRACARRVRWCWPSATTKFPNLLGAAGRRPAAREPLLHRRASVLSPASGGRGRQELSGRGVPGALRAGAYPTLVHRHRRAREHHRVLGAAGHREPHQGRVGEGAHMESRVVEITPTAVVVEGPAGPPGTAGRRRLPVDRLPSRHRTDAACRRALRS